MTLAADRAELRERWYQQGWYTDIGIADHLRLGAKRYPRATIHFVGGPQPASIELGDMYQRSLNLAGGLAELGVGPGDVVAIWVPNWIEGALTYQAAMMLGATVVPIVHIYGPREVSFILRQSEARVLVMPDRWRTIDYIAHFGALDDVSTLQHVVVIGEHRAIDGALPWRRLADSTPPAQLRDVGPDERCLLIYTSGTTAEPKGVQHTTNTLISEVMTTAAAIGDHGGIHLAAFPAGHIAGVLALLRMAVLGSSSVVMDAWDATLAARLVEQYRVTWTTGAPFYLASMMDAAEANGNDLSSLQGYMVGAASVPSSMVERAEANNIPVYRAYGSSEHPVISTSHPSDPLAKRAGTDGRLVQGTEVRLLDDDDREVPLGGDGEIVSRGPDLFVGYTDPALDAASFLPGGWFRTGDIGRLDADGFLTITDRKKDVIIRGGENIASKEVEDLLALHPAVAEAAVVGQADERYGERVAAFVQLRPGQELDLAEVRRHFATLGVAKQKTPEHLQTIAEFPRTPSGKVRKVELRGRLGS